MPDAKRSTLCGHCNKVTVFEPRGEGTKNGATLDLKYHDGQEITSWRILECQWCKRPTLEEIVTSYSFKTDDVYGWMDPVSFEITILYPEEKPVKTPLTNLPEMIERKYLAALKVQNVEPSACAVLAGRALEAICNFEKAAGKTLSDKLNNLVSSDRIPKTLAEMAHQLRQIRNLGAHDADDEVTEEDVPIILDFLEAILEYLYVAPAKIVAVQKRLKKTS